MKVAASAMLDNLSLAVQRQAGPSAGASADEQAAKDSFIGDFRVTLSELGRNRAAAKDQDIDDSSLPDSIKETLKLIRALKAQIAEKKAELQALMRDQSLDETQRLQRADALQTELSSLSSALLGANATLIKLMRESNLSPEQVQQAGSLAMV
ncbi:MAG: hypothetical protein ABWY06_00210 [Pseudomonas sp.]|uniref:hypothetical protein n=1 Tax=Pseudomonas sp. TaxID=306 RepID=UPI00339A21FF